MKTVTTKIRLLTAVVKGERDIDKGLKTFEICDGAINSPENRVRNSPEHLEGSRSSQFGHISFQSRKQLYIHKCPFVRSFVCSYIDLSVSQLLSFSASFFSIENFPYQIILKD